MRRIRCGFGEAGSVGLGAFGGVAEWLGSGLQSRVRRFDSGPRLEGGACLPGFRTLVLRCETHRGDWRSWLARLHDTQEVTGSTPVSPTLLTRSYKAIAGARGLREDEGFGEVGCWEPFWEPMDRHRANPVASLVDNPSTGSAPWPNRAGARDQRSHAHETASPYPSFILIA